MASRTDRNYKTGMPQVSPIFRDLGKLQSNGNSHNLYVQLDIPASRKFGEKRGIPRSWCIFEGFVLEALYQGIALAMPQIGKHERL